MPRHAVVAVSSGAPVAGAGARQHYTHQDLFQAIAARLSETSHDVTLQNRATSRTDVVVFPDDPAVGQPSRTALAKAPAGVKCMRISAFLSRFGLRPLTECESAVLRARLATIGEPCACDLGCYSKSCDAKEGRCTKKPRKTQTKPRARRTQTTPRAPRTRTRT